MLIYVQGPEPFLAKKAIDQLKAKYLEKNATSSELIDLRADETLPNWADLQAVPLFATSRLVIIRQAGALPIEAQRQLADFVTRLPATTVAVVWDGKKPGAELAAALQAATKTIPAQPLVGSQLKSWAKARAVALGLTVDDQTLGQILDGAGSDLWFIETELVYLAAAGSLEPSAKKAVDEPFIYFNLVRQRAWAKIASQLAADFRRGQPFELLLGSLAAAIRKEVRDRDLKVQLVNLMSDLDFGAKTGLLEPGEAISLLAHHLPKPAGKRLQWETVWEETVA